MSGWRGPNADRPSGYRASCFRSMRRSRLSSSRACMSRTRYAPATSSPHLPIRHRRSTPSVDSKRQRRSLPLLRDLANLAAQPTLRFRRFTARIRVLPMLRRTLTVAALLLIAGACVRQPRVRTGCWLPGDAAALDRHHHHGRAIAVPDEWTRACHRVHRGAGARRQDHHAQAWRAALRLHPGGRTHRRLRRTRHAHVSERAWPSWRPWTSPISA